MNKNLKLKFSNFERSIVSNSIGKELCENSKNYNSEVIQRLNEIFDISESDKLDDLLVGDYELIKDVVGKYSINPDGVEEGVPFRIQDRLLSKIKKNILLNSGDFHLIEDELFDLFLSDNEYKFIDKFLNVIINGGRFIDYIGVDDMDLIEVRELKNKLLEGFRMFENVYQITLHEVNILMTILLNDIGYFKKILYRLKDIIEDIRKYRINDLYEVHEVF